MGDGRGGGGGKVSYSDFCNVFSFMIRVFFTHEVAEDVDRDLNEEDAAEIRIRGPFSKISSSRRKWMKLTATVTPTDDTETGSDREQLVNGEETPPRRKCLPSKKPSLALALLLAFKRPLLASAFIKLCQDSLSFASPWILQYVSPLFLL